MDNDWYCVVGVKFEANEFEVWYWYFIVVFKFEENEFEVWCCVVIVEFEAKELEVWYWVVIVEAKEVEVVISFGNWFLEEMLLRLEFDMLELSADPITSLY